MEIFPLCLQHCWEEMWCHRVKLGGGESVFLQLSVPLLGSNKEFFSISMSFAKKLLYLT